MDPQFSSPLVPLPLFMPVFADQVLHVSNPLSLLHYLQYKSSFNGVAESLAVFGEFRKNFLGHEYYCAVVGDVCKYGIKIKR